MSNTLEERFFMSRNSSPMHQAGEGSAWSDRGESELQIAQPVDLFEEMPRGLSDEEIGFGSLAFEDRVIIERGPGRRRPARPASAEALPRLRLARAFARM